MPKVVNVTDDQIDWLRKNHDAMSLNDVATRIGVCVDTLKRILVREGIREFEGAKYVVARKERVWPCGSGRVWSVVLKNAVLKSWYYCKRCRASRGYDDD